MSNRFHSKFHRQNHHTYVSATNPDAGHDPIASPEQPFRGDFVLSGALSCYAGTSATAGFFGTNNTALCAIAGYRGIYAKATTIAGEFNSTTGGGVSAFGNLIGGDFYSNTRGLRSHGTTYGIETYSPNTALNVSGVNVGIYSYSQNVALSVNSPLTGASIKGDGTSLLTYGNGVNILNNRTGILKTPNASYGSYSLSNIVLDVNGDLLVSGNTVITGNLSALGNLTQLDTFLHVTSSIVVNNTGTDAAATIIQTGAYPILVCYDSDISSTVPSFLVDGAKNGWVALGTATPTAPLTIQKSTSATQGNNQPQIRITDDGTTNKVSISTPITSFTRSYVGTESNTSFDIVTNSTAKITVLNGGNVGINETNPGAKLSVSGSISGNSTFTNVGDIAGKSKLTVDGAISGASTLTVDSDILGKTKLTSYGAISGASTLTVDSDILGKTKLTSYGAISGASTLTVDSDILGKTKLTAYGAISGRSTLTIDSTSYFGNNLTVNGTLSSNSTAIVTRLSAYDFVLNHPTPNDGLNPAIFIGEMGDGTAGTIAGSLSGFITTYDELQNKYVIKTQFAAVTPLSAIVIDQNANVGIGVASPNKALTVNGDISATNSVYCNNINGGVFTPVSFGITTVNGYNFKGAINSITPTLYTVPTGRIFIPESIVYIIDTLAGSSVSGDIITSLRVTKTDLTALSNSVNTGAGSIAQGSYYRNYFTNTGSVKAYGSSGDTIVVKTDAILSSAGITALSGRILVSGILI